MFYVKPAKWNILFNEGQTVLDFIAVNVMEITPVLECRSAISSSNGFVTCRWRSVCLAMLCDSIHYLQYFQKVFEYFVTLMRHVQIQIS